MKKRFYTFDNIVSESGDTFKNFTLLKSLPESVLIKSDLYVTIELEDNEKIEYISNKYYNTMNYWDILLLLNNVKDINLLPKDQDSLIVKQKALLDEHIEKFEIKRDYDILDEVGKAKIDTYIDNKYKEIGEELDKENEIYRTFSIVKPQKITEFLKELDDYINSLKKG